MKKKKFFVLLSVISLILLPAQNIIAGEEDTDTGFLSGYEAVIYGKGGGLPSVEVNVINQTPEGYLWIGTYSGLYRYDGRTFKKEVKDSRVSAVMALLSDSEGRLWIGTNDSGVAYYAPWESEMLFCTKDEGLPSNSIRALTEDGKGNIYIGTVEGLSILDIDGNVTNPAAFSDLGGIRSLASYDGTIAGVTNSGVLFIVEGEEVVIRLTSGESGVDFTSVAISEENYLMVGTSSSEVKQFFTRIPCFCA